MMDKYRWHDLAKDASDLPVNGSDVIVYHGNYQIVQYYNAFNAGPYSDKYAFDNVVAWRYIEPFNDVKAFRYCEVDDEK